jgi:hypothetical protein
MNQSSEPEPEPEPEPGFVGEPIDPCHQVDPLCFYPTLPLLW